MAGIELTKGRWSTADQLIDEGLNISPNEGRLLMYRLESTLERGMFDEAHLAVHQMNNLMSNLTGHFNTVMGVWPLLSSILLLKLCG